MQYLGICVLVGFSSPNERAHARTEDFADAREEVTLIRRQPLRFRVEQLARELVELRGRAGKTIAQVIEDTSLDQSTIYRAEHPTSRTSNRSTVATLLDCYGVTDPRQRARLLALLKPPSTDPPEWLHVYDDIMDKPYVEYVTLETDAAEVCAYESLVLPGPLQTFEYATAALVGSFPALDADSIRRLAEILQLRRTALLDDRHPVRLTAVLDEAAVRRVVGGPEVMRTQLRDILEQAASGHVTIRVVPYEAGAHPGMSGSFSVVTFVPGSSLEPVVLIISTAGYLLRDDEVSISRYIEMFRHVEALALSPTDSLRLIDGIARRLK
jgi:hypothetical protein